MGRLRKVERWREMLLGNYKWFNNTIPGSHLCMQAGKKEKEHINMTTPEVCQFF